MEWGHVLELNEIYYGTKCTKRTHRLSLALCKRAKESGEVVWLTEVSKTLQARSFRMLVHITTPSHTTLTHHPHTHPHTPPSHTPSHTTLTHTFTHHPHTHLHTPPSHTPSHTTLTHTLTHTTLTHHSHTYPHICSFSRRLYSNLSLLGPELRLRFGLESGVSDFAEKNILNSAIV